MNRERFAWSASVVLLVLLAFEIPGSLAQRDDDYRFVRTLLDVRKQVVDNYVEDVDETKLHDAAITGMLATLDPYSNYFPPAEQLAFDNYLAGKFLGVGIRLEQQPDGDIEIVTPLEGSPAANAGVLPGDIILEVDGRKIYPVKVDELVKKMSGKKGSQVSIKVRHLDNTESTYEMVRDEVQQSSVHGYKRGADNKWVYYVNDNPKIGYVRLSQFTPDSYRDLRAVLDQLVAEGMKGFILDLRFDGGGSWISRSDHQQPHSRRKNHRDDQGPVPTGESGRFGW